MGWPPTLPEILLHGWKLMFPFSPVAPLFVMARQVEQGAFFSKPVVFSLEPRMIWVVLSYSGNPDTHR